MIRPHIVVRDAARAGSVVRLPSSGPGAQTRFAVSAGAALCLLDDKAAQRRLSGRDAEDPLVQPLPIRRDRALHGAETNRASADHRMQSVLEPVLDPEARPRVELLRVEVRDVVGAAELQADDVVDLQRTSIMPGPHPVVTLDGELLRLGNIPDRTRPEPRRSRSRHSSACCSRRPASSADQGSGRACNRRSSFDGQEAPSRQQRPSPTSSVPRVSSGTGSRRSFRPASPPLPGDANRSPDGAGKSCTYRRGNARSLRPARRQPSPAAGSPRRPRGRQAKRCASYADLYGPFRSACHFPLGSRSASGPTTKVPPLDARSLDPVGSIRSHL